MTDLVLYQFGIHIVKEYVIYLKLVIRMVIFFVVTFVTA